MDDIETGTPESSADDLRSALADSLKTETAPEPVAAEDAGKLAEKTEAAAGDRPRAPDGKFLPKEPETADKALAQPTEAAKPETPTETRKPETPASPAALADGVKAPEHWSAADKEKFASLPAEGRAHFLDMYKRVESWYTPKLQRLAHLERDYAPVMDMFAPHAEALRTRGQVPADVIKAWGNVEQTFLNHRGAVESGQQPGAQAAQAVARIIAGYKIDPADIARLLTGMASGEMPVAAQPMADPRVDHIAQQLQQLTAAEQERRTMAERQSLNNMQSQIDTFANDKDGEGNLKHPFFAEVEQDIAVLAQLDRAQGKTPSLPELYERAVWASQSTRDKLLAFQKDSEAKRAAVERKAKSEAAARAAVSVSGSPGSAQPADIASFNKAASATDDLRASMQELRG